MQILHPRWRTIMVGVATVLASAGSVAASPAPAAARQVARQAVRHAAPHARYRQGLWTGIAEPGNSRFTFTVHGSKLSRFVAPEVGCFAITGYQVTSFAMPRAVSIASRGRFSERNRNTDTLTGRFTGAAAAAGTFSQKKGCDIGENWKARPGKTPPSPPQPPKPAACTVGHACPATDGLRIQVTGVDTTLESVQNPAAGPYSDTVDHAYDAPPAGTGGGVLVLFRVTNSSASPVTFTTSGGEWTLLDGAGGHDASRNENDLDMTTGDARIGTDSTTCSNQAVTVAPGQTTPVESLCFAVPQSARHGLKLLFDYPTTMASVPLD